MLGMGHVSGDKDGTLEYAVKTKGLYRYLVNDDDGSWSTSHSVRNVRVMSSGNGSMHVYHNEFMTIRGETIGPEFGIGHCLEQAASADTPIMLLKSLVGIFCHREVQDMISMGGRMLDIKTVLLAGHQAIPNQTLSDGTQACSTTQTLLTPSRSLPSLTSTTPMRHRTKLQGSFGGKGTKIDTTLPMPRCMSGI